MTLRRLSGLAMTVGQPVRDAIRSIEARGGRHTHDSGHQKGPTWIYTFPGQDGQQIALRINKDKLSVYVRADPRGRTDFETEVARWSDLEQTYPNAAGEKPANSLLSEEHARGLTPLRHRLLRLRVRDGQFDALLDAYLGIGPNVPSRAPSSDMGSSSTSQNPRRPRVISPQQLQEQLDRQSETGRAGERIAYRAELDRLAALGCPTPSVCVTLVAEENVAAGYDLLSEWNGERRCIEVKTTAGGREEIYLSENERQTLEQLGDQGWIYFVELTKGAEGEVVLRIQNPIARLPRDGFRPAIWQVSLAASLNP